MAVRTIRKILRTPQIIGIAIAQSIVFLIMFRYVLGGAMSVPRVSYVDFLVPGFVVAGMLFTAGGSAVAVAEDAASGLYDRLRSRPISDTAVLMIGRGIADAALMVLVGLVTLGAGFIIGAGIEGTALDVLLAIVLIVVYALRFAGVFVWDRARQRQRPGRTGNQHPRRAVRLRVGGIRRDRQHAERAQDLRRLAAADVHGERVARAARRRRRDRELLAQPRSLRHRLPRLGGRTRRRHRPACPSGVPQTLTAFLSRDHPTSDGSEPSSPIGDRVSGRGRRDRSDAH
jgi:ABC-2 type transporter